MSNSFHYEPVKDRKFSIVEDDDLTECIKAFAEDCQYNLDQPFEAGQDLLDYLVNCGYNTTDPEYQDLVKAIDKSDYGYIRIEWF